VAQAGGRRDAAVPDFTRSASVLKFQPNVTEPSNKPAFAWPVRVYFEDTDAAGVVYHANYLRFLERARTEWLRARGWSLERLRTEAGISFVVTRMSIDFRRAARLDDALLATADIASARRVSMMFAQSLVAADDPARVYVSADVEVACIDLQTMRPRRVTDVAAFADARS
jgi:acyl-CoA thioester hydrolase